jgi:hypothetical protein
MATADKFITFEDAYHFLNERLFDNQLELCVITFNCDGVQKAVYVPNSFNEHDGGGIRDEIALNQSLFSDLTDVDILSTLAHEMVHKWQHDHGKPGKDAYHNKEWAKAMKRIGLKPFNITNPDRETGPACAHRIMKDGLFAQVSHELATNKVKLNRQLQETQNG